MKIYLIFLLIITVSSLVSSQLNTQTCDSYPTCSPIQCNNVTNTACTFSATTVNVTSAISAIACNPSCTQSTLPICSNSSLASLFNTGFAKGLPYGIKAAYCNDQYLVIHSDGTPSHTTESLYMIPRPPGGDGPYTSACVTRTKQSQFYSYKVPLYPVALSTSSGTVNNVNSFINNMITGVALPFSGPVAVTLTGVPLYPAFNNVGQFTWAVCEVDACNAHVGKGADYHYHGDPFSSVAGKCLYSPTDYASTTSHPPLIALSADGYTVYGRYLSTSAPGYSVALDDCGGHVHDSYGYHYHAQVLNITSSAALNGIQKGSTYTAYIPGPYKCWKGDISKNKNFWDTQYLSVGYQNSRTSNSLPTRNDYASVQPCCNSNSYLKNY